MQPYKGVDTTVKHLLHMTGEELRPNEDSAVLERDWNLLLEEARAKIRPVLKVMSDEELDSICSDMAELREDKQVFINKDKFHEIMNKNGITLEELRKI